MTGHQAPAGAEQGVKARWLATYRTLSLVLAVSFAVVGLLFLLLPGSILRFFNDLSVLFGLDSTSTEGYGFYLILAVGYMYVVTVLAWSMYRHPDNHSFPLLLTNAKLASSLLSFIFFFGISQAFITLVNGVVDGCIGGGIFLMDRARRRLQ